MDPIRCLVGGVRQGIGEKEAPSIWHPDALLKFSINCVFFFTIVVDNPVDNQFRVCERYSLIIDKGITLYYYLYKITLMIRHETTIKCNMYLKYYLHTSDERLNRERTSQLQAFKPSFH